VIRCALWIKRRVLKNPEFTEGIDYEKYDGLSFPESGSSKARPQKTVEPSPPVAPDDPSR
jgi:hypothetical protein